jgi:hypothetical protein
MPRPLTDFERQHGYTPCPFELGDDCCGVKADLIRAMGVGCGGTHWECVWWGNEHRFGGQLVPGHPLGRLLLRTIPHVQVVVEEGALDSYDDDGAAGDA